MDSTKPRDASIVNPDPPRHRQLRSLASQAFTPRAIAKLTQRISEIVHQLLDHVVSRGRMDVIDDLSYPLPVMVIAEMLGVPLADRERFKRWSDQVVGATSSSAQDPQQEMSEYFLWMIEQRRREPHDDLISALLAAQDEGQRLSVQELLGFCIILLVAGNETTTHLIGNAFLCFDEYPDVVQHLRAEPALLPDAIEEVLRYRSPLKGMFRAANMDIQIGDQSIPAGPALIAWIGSSNRAAPQFPRAKTIILSRSPNRHLAFGYGIHFCLGAPLARLEAKIALGIMLERLQ